MKHLRLALSALLALGGFALAAPAFALDEKAVPPQCAPLSDTYIRDGTTNCAYLMKVNSDGSINVNATVTFTPSGTQDVNEKQLNGVTVSVGNGTTDTGTQRVTLSSDGTGQVKDSNFPTTVDTNTGAVGASTIRIAPGTGASTDASGTVTLGNTYQTVFASSVTRKGCLIQNPTTATEVLNVKVGTMASPFTLSAGSSFSCAAGPFVVSDAITVTAATTSHAFAAVSQ